MTKKQKKMLWRILVSAALLAAAALLDLEANATRLGSGLTYEVVSSHCDRGRATTCCGGRRATSPTARSLTRIF